MKLRFASMTVGLPVGVTAAVVVACSSAAWVYSAHHFDTLLKTARSTALAESELIRVALEHQMIENDRTLIARMVDSFGKQSRVERIMLLDRYGVQRYSSGLPASPAELDIQSDTCQACHRYPPDQRGSSRVIETSGGTILRTVVPIRNRQECHRCHDPGHKINGVLMLDYGVGEIRATMARELQGMVAGTALLTLLLVGSIALLIRVLVVRRLQRFETTARLIAAGNLEKRVPAEGTDTISWLAREFNAMADSVTGLATEVHHERERLETVINSIDDGIVVLDSHRQVIAANDAFVSRTGYSRTQVLGCCCTDAAPAACNSANCPTVACLRSGTRQVRIYERGTPGGAVAWEEVHASPVRDRAGSITHVVEVWRDISDRRAAEARLSESHRLASLGLLASGFSHELNTPLATILTCVEGILRDTTSGEAGDGHQRVKDNATIAREQLLRCRGITQQFLRMSRGRGTSASIVELDGLITTAQRLLEPTAKALGVTVDVEPAASGIHVHADEAELQNVIINLALNAIQACKPGGRVSMRAAVDGRAHVFVNDTGCGISPDDLKRIFEPFFSLRNGGTGLGLFLSLNAVRKYGGDIVVESTPHKGSSFEIILPLRPAGSEEHYR